ncbi:trypsin, putative [Eimeria brunetti]|uniref:Trypsin, putative n=1 Tax=Eimeria brunetti TaxID=51314 RepID=U6LDT5_9EIME|nr:trypsin, putative [Eimeria brunetti]
MESGPVAPLAAAVQELCLLAAVPAPSDSRKDLAKQELLRRIELLLQEQQLQQQERHQRREQWNSQVQWDNQRHWPTHKRHVDQQQEKRQQDQQQQEQQEWMWRCEGDAAAQTGVLERLEESLLLLCCQQPPPALQRQLLRLLLLLVHSTEDCGIGHRVAARLLAAAGEKLHLSPSVSAPLSAAALPPTAAAGAAAATGTTSVLSPLPPLQLCGELFKACPQALSPLLPLLVAVGSKLLQAPATPEAATAPAAAATAAAVAKALRTAVAATGACGEALAGKLFSLALACLRCSTSSRSSSSSRRNSSRMSTKVVGSCTFYAAEAARESLLLVQQVVWAFPRGVSTAHGEALFTAVLAAAAPEPVLAATAVETDDMFEQAQENVPHAAAALAALLSAKAIAGMQQQQQVKEQQQVKQQAQALLDALDEPADFRTPSSSAADFASLSLEQCMTAAAATAAAAAASTQSLFSEVRSVEGAFTLLRRQWLLLHVGAAPDSKKGSVGFAAAARYIPVLLPQEQDSFLLHIKAKKQGLLRQTVAAAMPLLCRFLLRCLPPVSLASTSLKSLFTLLAQLTTAESCCSCSKRGGAIKGLQEQCVGVCSCCCACSENLPPPACCLSLETLHSQALVSHAAQQLLPLLQPQQQLGLVDCLSRAIAAAATGATAPQEPTEAGGSAGCSSRGGSFAHPLLLRAALNILEATIVAAGEAGVVAFPPSLHAAFVSILTVKNPLHQVQQQQQQLLRCAFWPAVQRQAAACIWRIRCLSDCPLALHSLKLELMQAGTKAAEAALKSSTQGKPLDVSQFAGLWGACLGFAACIAKVSPTELQQPATAAATGAASAVTGATATATALAYTKEESGFSNITALLDLLASGGAEARACFFLLAEALLQLPAAASGAFAAAATAAEIPVENEGTQQAALMSPIVCRFLRSIRGALSLNDSRSTINRLLHLAAAASGAAGGPAATQHSYDAAARAAADTEPGEVAEGPAAGTATAEAPNAEVTYLLLELTCAFKALAALMRQQPGAAATTIRDVDTDCNFVALTIKVSSLICCCCCSSNSREPSLHSITVHGGRSSEAQQQQQQHHQQQVCCRCICRGSTASVATAHAGLEAAVLQALSVLPHTQIHCSNQQQQKLLLQMALAAVTIPAKGAHTFPAAAVACCINPVAVAPAAALRAAPMEQLQQQQILVQQLLLQQQQQGTADSALFLGCGTEMNSLGGPTLWEAQWRCAADLTMAAFNALRLPALVAVAAPSEAGAGAAEIGWRADYPPHVLSVLQGALLLRRLFCSCTVCSPAAEAALQQTAFEACCSWGRQLPPVVSLDASAVRPIHRSGKLEDGEARAACGSAEGRHRPSGSLKASRPQQLLQRFGLPRLKKKTICAGPTAVAAKACFAAEHGSSGTAPERSQGNALQMSIVAAVLSGVFRTRPAPLWPPTQQQQQVSSSAVDTLWCCCEKALATAPPLERLLSADVAGGLYCFLRSAHSPHQQQPHQGAATTTGLQTVNKHLAAYLEMPFNTSETRGDGIPLVMTPSRLCSVSLLASRLLPLLQHPGFSAAEADGNRKRCQDLLQLALAAASSIEATEEAAATSGEHGTTPTTNYSAAAASISPSCTFLCVIRFLGVALPAVASDSAVAYRITTDSRATAGATAKSPADLTFPKDQQQLQQQQQSVLQEQLFRTLQFLFLLRSCQSHIHCAELLAADAARHVLECLLQHAAAAGAVGPDALLSATEDFISHAAREASYLLSTSVKCAADSSNSTSSSGIVLQVVAAAPAVRCLTALMWIQSSASAARTAAVAAEGKDSTLAAAALSLRTLLPAVVAATELAIASPSLVVRREAARSLLFMSRPLKETTWGPTIAAAGAGAPPEVATAAAEPVTGDPQLALFLLEALNSECDLLQQQLLLQVLRQQVRIWGPGNLIQWISLLTALCCRCTPASCPSAHGLSALRPSSSSTRDGSTVTVLLQRAQQLLPQTPKMLLSPLAAARPLPALTGFVWRPLPGVSEPAAARNRDESCHAEPNNSSNDSGCIRAKVEPVVCLAAAECLELLLTLPEVQQERHWSVHAAGKYQEKHGEVLGATTAGPLVINCLPLLFRAACELLLQGIRQQQQQQQQPHKNGRASDRGGSLARWGLQILLLLLQKLGGTCLDSRDPQGLPAQQLQKYEVDVSSAVSGLLRCYSASSTQQSEMPEKAAAVAAAVADALAAEEGDEARALHEAAFLRLRAAAAGGDAIHNEENQQQRKKQQLYDLQQQELTAKALEVMLKFAEAGCCLSPWRLVGQLLLPLGDVAQSAAALVTAAAVTTPATTPSDWLVHRRLLLACRLVDHVAAAATQTASAAPFTPTGGATTFVEQHEQWVAAIEPCAVPLALHLMAHLLKRHRQQEQVEQQHQRQQQWEENQLLMGLALLCRPLTSGRRGRQAAAASAAFAALAAASRSDSARGIDAAAEARATATEDAAHAEACCSVLMAVADMLLRPLETAAAACESCTAEAYWSNEQADSVCWMLELICSLLLCLCFHVDPQQQQRQQSPQQQQHYHHQPGEDWAEDWGETKSAASSSGAPVPAAVLADASTSEVTLGGSAASACLYPDMFRRACEAARRLAAASAQAAAEGASGLVAQDCSSPAAASLTQQAMRPFDEASEPKTAAVAFAQKVVLADSSAAGESAGRVVYCCIYLLWSFSAALQQNSGVLAEDTAALAFFTAIRDVSKVALWLPVDAAPPAAGPAADDRPSGTLCEAALSLLQRGLSVVAVMPSAAATVSAVSLLLAPLEAPAFPARLCNRAANSVSPLEAMRLLRSLYEAAARAAGAVAVAAETATNTSTPNDGSVVVHATTTSLLGHCASLIESAVSIFTGTTAALGSEPQATAAAAAPAVPSAAAGDSLGVLALAAALVAVDALSLTNGPWNISTLNERGQQQQQPEWYARVRTALRQLSEFAYAVDADSGHAELAAAAAKTADTRATTGTLGSAATAKVGSLTAAGTEPTASGDATGGAADVALVLERGAASTTAGTASQGETGTDAAAGFMLFWPAPSQHAAAQLRGFLLRVARVYNQSPGAAPDSFPSLLAAAAVSCLLPVLSPPPSGCPNGGTRCTFSKNDDSSQISRSQLSTIETRHNHPLKSLEAFLLELSPQTEVAGNGSDFSPLSETLVAALGSVIAGVLTLQAEADAAENENAQEPGRASAAATGAAAGAGTTTPAHSTEAISDAGAAAAEDIEAGVVAPDGAATKASPTTLDSSAPDEKLVAAAGKTAALAPREIPQQCVAVECTAAAPKSAALAAALDSATPEPASLAAASYSAAPESTPSDSPTPNAATAAPALESSGPVPSPESAETAAPVAAAAEELGSTPAFKMGTPVSSGMPRAAYLDAASSLLYLAVSRHPAVSARAIEAAATAAHAGAATDLIRAPASIRSIQQVKAAVARVLQEEIERRQLGEA